MRASTERHVRPSASSRDQEGVSGFPSSLHTSVASADYRSPGPESPELLDRSLTPYSQPGLRALERSHGAEGARPG